MFTHRFHRPETSDSEQTEFLRDIRRGTFQGAFLTFVGKLMCFIRIHVGTLQVDDLGLYRVCDRCGYSQPWLDESMMSLWKNDVRSRKPPQLNK